MPPTPADHSTSPGAEAVLDALPQAVVVLDGDGRVRRLNMAAEHLLAAGRRSLLGTALHNVLPADSPLLSLVAQAHREGQSVAQEEVELDTPRRGPRGVTATAAPVPDSGGHVALTLRERTMARKLDRQLVHRGAARSVSGMAALLAHEVKNPLAGIRGAAQLLDRTAGEGDQRLTGVIREEADRIVALLDEMEVFSDERPIERQPVNIHEVLDHVKHVAQAGVAQNTAISEAYDPSLPPVLGNRNLLIQAFLNLVKNAAEAVPGGTGRVTLGTRFQHGVRLAVPGGSTHAELPLVVTVRDTGPGIPGDLRDHLFDPFVSTKVSGRGLGLALVAKVVSDHGGVIECDSDSRGTAFHVHLPMAKEGTA